jgi:hypothetical protein
MIVLSADLWLVYASTFTGGANVRRRNCKTETEQMEMPRVRAEGNALRCTIGAAFVRKPRVTSEKDCEHGESMKLAFKILAGSVTVAVSGLFVYLWYLLIAAAKNNSDEMYTR